MGYELYLRRPGDRPPDEAALSKRLAELGGRLEGTRYVLGVGSARLAVQRDEKGFLGYDLEVPFGCPEKELREAFSAVVSLADVGPLTLFDPQLGRSVSKGSDEEVVAAWRNASSWQVDVAGVREDPRGIAPVIPVKPMIDPRTRLLVIAVVGVLAFIWVISKALFVFFSSQ